MAEKTRMYENVRTWNPFVGCRHGCTYCYAQRIAKRQKQRCMDCYNFEPHYHSERLDQSFRPAETVFVCSMGDIAFASYDQFSSILDVIRKHRATTFYLQSKNPFYFYNFIKTGELIPCNAVIGTTLETNRYVGGYSDAPAITERVEAMWLLPDSYHRYVTIEPVMDFDLEPFIKMLLFIKPDFVYVGYNSQDSAKQHLLEPALAKTELLIGTQATFTEVRKKLIRKAWWE